jgi:hypothetical protein
MNSLTSLALATILLLILFLTGCSKSEVASPVNAKEHTIRVEGKFWNLNSQFDRQGNPVEMDAQVSYSIDGGKLGTSHGYSNDIIWAIQPSSDFRTTIMNSGRSLTIDLDFMGINKNYNFLVSHSAMVGVNVTVDGQPANSSPIVLNRDSPYRANGIMGFGYTIDLTKF